MDTIELLKQKILYKRIKEMNQDYIGKTKLSEV